MFNSATLKHRNCGQRKLAAD